MVLNKYLRPKKDSSGDHTNISVPSATVAEVTKHVEEELKREKKQRGEYIKLSPEEKAKIGKYASENGVARAVRKFSEKKVKESSIRDWRRMYEKELKDKKQGAQPGIDIVVSASPLKKRGKPPLLGFKLDKYLQEMFTAMRNRGTPIGTRIVQGIGCGLMLKHQKSSLEEFGGSTKLRQKVF